MTKFDYKINKDKKVVKVYRLIEIATAVLVLAAVFFVKYVLDTEFGSAEKYLQQSNMQTASNLKGRITNSINEMETLSVKMSLEVKDFTESEVMSFLSKHISDYDYFRLIFAFPNGTAVRYQKGKGKISSIDWKYDSRFISSMKGKPAFIATEKNDSVECGFTNSFSVPVYDRNGKIRGVIGSLVDASNYIKILGLNNYDEKGFSFIIKEDGGFILTPGRFNRTNDNFFERDLKYFGVTKEDIQKYVIKEDNGIFRYKYNGQKYIAAFSIIGKTKFYILTIVPLNVLMLNTDKLLTGIASIVILIGLLLMGLLYYTARISEENEKIIYDAAFVDSVTGFGNKNKFRLDAQRILNKNQDAKYAIICVEIKKFKAIDELYGSECAEKILKEFMEILNKRTGENGICVRDYSANYVVLYRYKNEEDIIDNFINKLTEDAAACNETTMRQLSSSKGALVSAKIALSFGIYPVENRDITIDQMCERASLAKKDIRDNVLKTYNFYDDKLRMSILEDKEIEDEMYSALSEEQFKMFLQPKFDLQTQELVGAEALVRWIHPVKGMISPMRFVPLFEANGFIIELDVYIWKQACKFLADRKKNGLRMFPISINVSRLHLHNDAFISELMGLIETYDIEPEYLELELTETACFNSERFEDIVKKLKELKFTISMDDFGAGYSSLNMLRHLPIDVLKLDRGFIKNTISDKKGQIVTTSIIEMANKLNMITVSEGVETEEQAEFMRNIGCKIAQGFLYGKPMDVEGFKENFLKDEKIPS